jgi:hypothetical protein
LAVAPNGDIYFSQQNGPGTEGIRHFSPDTDSLVTAGGVGPLLFSTNFVIDVAVAPDGSVISEYRVDIANAQFYSEIDRVDPTRTSQMLLQTPSSLGPLAVAANGDIVFVQADTISRLPAGGGSPVTIETLSPNRLVNDLAVAPDGTIVESWSVQGSNTNGISRVNPASGQETQLLTNLPLPAASLDVGADGSIFYVQAVSNGLNPPQIVDTLFRLPAGGGSPDTVLTLAPNSSVEDLSVFNPGPPVQYTSVAFDHQGNQVTDIITSTGDLFQYDQFGRHLLARGTRAVGVTFDPTGNLLTDIVFANGDLFQYDRFGVHRLSGGVQAVGVTFDPAGHLLTDIVFANGDLFQYDAFGIHRLIGGARAVSVTFDPAGHIVTDIVFANGTLYQYDFFGDHRLLGGIQSAGVTFDPSGQIFTEIFFTSGALFQFDSAGIHFLGNF